MLGILFHFIIATTAAAVYYLASRQIKFLTDHAFIAGILCGVMVYLFELYRFALVSCSKEAGAPFRKNYRHADNHLLRRATYRHDSPPVFERGRLSRASRPSKGAPSPVMPWPLRSAF